MMDNRTVETVLMKLDVVRMLSRNFYCIIIAFVTRYLDIVPVEPFISAQINDTISKTAYKYLKKVCWGQSQAEVLNTGFQSGFQYDS